MEAVFDKIFDICSEHGKMQEFCLFTDNIHKIARCEDENCDIEKFLKFLTKNVFNEDMSYDERRKFFIQHCMENVLVFNAVYKLQLKEKENVGKIEALIATSENMLHK